MIDRLYDLVCEAYENVILNGEVDFSDYTLEELSFEMMAYHDDLAMFDLEDVMKSLKEHLKSLKEHFDSDIYYFDFETK